MPVDPRELAAIFLGGVAGALARAGVVEALPVHPGAWPWGTFLVNVAGAAILGALITWAHERAEAVPEHLPPLLIALIELARLCQGAAAPAERLALARASLAAVILWVIPPIEPTLPSPLMVPVPATNFEPLRSPVVSLSTTARLNIRPADGPPMLARLKSMVNGAHGALSTATPR